MTKKNDQITAHSMFTRLFSSNACDIRFADFCFTFVLILIAITYAIGKRSGEFPFVSFESSDASELCSYIASLYQPDLFKLDGLFFDQKNYRFYATIHIPLLYYLQYFTHDCGNSFLWLAPVQIILQGMGFYCFGRMVFSSRLWAMALAICSLSPVSMNLGEYWGLMYETIPRALFQSLLPWILILAWKLKQNASLSWLTMLLIGLLMYVHPVSAPAWAFSLWLGTFLALPASWQFWKKCVLQIKLGLVFLITSSGFLAIYLSAHEHGARVNYNTVMEIASHGIKVHSMNDYFDLKVGLTNFVFSVFSPHLALGLLGMLYISVFERTAFAEIKLLYVWVLGLLLCCFFIPCADQFICRTLEVIPLQIDLVRGVRYLIPLSEIIFIASLALFSNRFNLFSRRLACSAGIALVLIIWPPPLDEIIKTVSHWGSGDLHLKPSAHAQATIQNLKEISRLVPEEALIHVDSGIDPILVRSIAHRSVAFVDKDQGVLFYGNHLGLLRWAQLRKELEEMAQPPARFFELIPWAKLHGISYIIVDYEPPEKSANSSPNFWKIIYPESSLDSNRTSTPGMYLIRLD